MTERHVKEWTVVLSGHSIDLTRGQEILKNVSYASIETRNNNGTTYHLISSRFDNLQESSTVKNIALNLIAIINGAIKITYPDSELIKSAGTCTMMYSDGSEGIAVEVTGIKCRMGLGEVTVLIDGAPQEKPLKIGTEVLLLAEQDSDIVDALHFFSRADNWFDLYKTYEVINQRVIEKLYHGNADLKKSSIFRENANYGRHARNKKPQVDMSLQDAQIYIHQVLIKWIESKNPVK